MTTVILASGGIDSTVLAAMHPEARHLSVNYGQPHLQEIRYAKAIAAHYGAPHAEWAARLPPPAGKVFPNRNAVLVSLAGAYAETVGAGVVLIGCNADDRDDFPDCGPSFLATMSAALYLATDGRVELRYPLISMTKAEIGALGRKLDAPLHLTWSCYGVGPAQCGACDACAGRERAGCT